MIEAATVHPALQVLLGRSVTRSTLRALLEIIRYTYENGIPSNDRVNYYHCWQCGTYGHSLSLRLLMQSLHAHPT